MATTVAAPPGNIGQRLLPSLVDEIAATDPNRVFYSIPKSRNLAEGFQDITAKEFAQVVDRCAWHLEETLGHGTNFPTLAYLGPQDVMYAVLILATVKAGYKLLLNSPRNALEAHLALFEKTDCHTFLLPPNFPLPVVKQILDARPMRVVEIPGLPHWLARQQEEGSHRPFPYTKTFAEARLDPLVVLHTSGSTGLPKPIVQTHGTQAPIDAYTSLPEQGLPDTYPAMCAGKRVYLAFPLFHCAGVSMLLPAAVYAKATIVLGTFPPSADSANAVHVHGNVDRSCLAPMTMIDLAKDPEHLETLSRLDQITYGGGPCPPAVGDLIAKKTRLLNCLGTTEAGVLPVQMCDAETWSYMSVNPALGHEYRHVSGDLYEQVIVRKPELDLYQGVFQTFPELQEWPMKDLYSKHPTKENQWLYRGRADDIIVFHTGEKLNPVDMESAISSSPLVSAALIAGQGQFQSSLLLEVVEQPASEEEKEKLIDSIWPVVEAANKSSPAHGRILRNMIILTSPEKPMLRAGKGTVQRKLTVDLYEAELEALYKANELPAALAGVSVSAEKSPEEAIKTILGQWADLSAGVEDPERDLFELGLDSLQVTVIAKQINQYLEAKGSSQFIDTRAVYANPSTSALTAVLSALLGGGSASRLGSNVTPQSLYEQYAAELPLSARQAETTSKEQRVILLTGSTGTLGSYVLDALQKDASIARIYCLNRGPNSYERQAKSQAEKGLSELSEKVQFFDAKLSDPLFGLSRRDYGKLLNEVTNVVHNAWQVDFNLALGSFASQVKAVKQLTEFSVLSRYGARLFFISSISAVSGSSEKVEERIYDDWSIVDEMGYGQSKFVSERLLDTAAKESGVPTAICRVGQIAGPTTEAGEWPKKEWFPSLIFSSQHLGKLPATLGQMEVIDWIPVDVLGQVIVDLVAFSPSTAADHGAQVFHTVNPQDITWSSLLPIVQKSLDSVEVVSLQEWIAALRESASKTEDLAQNPAIKIIDFYEGLLTKDGKPIVLETKHTVSASPTLGALESVQSSWMGNWLRQWFLLRAGTSG